MRGYTGPGRGLNFCPSCVDLSQCGAEALATSGDLLQWHPHGHILATDGAFSDVGTFHPIETWDSDT